VSEPSDLHYLVVPDSPDQAMEIEHPECCPQHGHLETVRHTDHTYVCPFEEEVREIGLEASFDRLGNPVPLFMEAPIKVRPGRYPVEFGLRFAAHSIQPAGLAPGSGSPLTCELCKNTAATALVVVDWPADRAKYLTCGDCSASVPVDMERLRLPYTLFTLLLEAT
jgi:hypothetical protein